jgi:hypothetical protein
MKEGLSRKTILHNEVQDKILDMLSNKEILYQNIPIEHLENNARLIKSFLYKEITTKYPKLNSYNKILRINQLKKNELFIILDKLPDLDEYSNMIENNKKNIKNYLKKKTTNTSDTALATNTSDTTLTTNTSDTTLTTNTSDTTLTTNTSDTTLATNITNINNTIETNNNILEIINDLQLDNNSTNSNIVNNVIKLIKNAVIVYSFYKLFRFLYN